MALFENVPYVNFHEMNLDWILKFIQETRNKLDQIEAAVLAAQAAQAGAETARAGAEDAQARAEEAADSAADSAADAETDAANAAGSAAQAAQSATNAAASATQAQQSATAAGNSATQAAQSAAAAGQNANAAAQSASSAAQSAGTATTAAGTATQQATAAAASAADAAESAGEIVADLTEVVKSGVTNFTVFSNAGDGVSNVIAFDCDLFTTITNPQNVPVCIISPMGDSSAAASPRGKYHIMQTSYYIQRNGHYLPTFEVYDTSTGAKAVDGTIINARAYIFTKATTANGVSLTALTA